MISVLYLLLIVGALVTVITADEGSVKHLPKMVWVLLIVFLPLIGSIVWFVVGKDWNADRTEAVSFGDPRRHEAVRQSVVSSTPEDEEEAIEAEIRFHEKQAEIRRLEAEVARKRQGQG